MTIATIHGHNFLLDTSTTDELARKALMKAEDAAGKLEAMIPKLRATIGDTSDDLSSQSERRRLAEGVVAQLDFLVQDILSAYAVQGVDHVIPANLRKAVQDG